MMKKLSRFITLFLALLTVFLVPVSASDIDNTGAWTNVLDYATLNDSGSNYISFTNSVTVCYDTEIESLVRYVDIIVNTSGADISAASINGKSLNVIALDSQVFRIFGALSYITSGVFNITFSSSGTTYLDVLQFHVSGQWRLSYDDVGALSWSSASTGTGYVAQSSPGEIVYTSWLDSDAAYPVFFYAMVSCDNWRIYDYLDVYIHATVSSIDSVTASYNGLFIPVEYDYLGGVESTTGNYKMHFRMDLTGLDRSLGGSPILNISGLYSPHVSTSCVQLRYVMGSVVTDPVDPYLNFFRIYADSQFAYYDDILTVQRNMSSLISSGFRSLSADILAAEGHLAKVVSDFQSALTFKLTNFQTSIENWFSTISGKLDQLIGGTSEGDDLSQDAADLEDQISDVHDFEQEQQDILDNALPDMQQAVAVTKFSSALAFVQRYINMGWLALGDFTIIYTLPIFIGLFFFICGRIPGVTRWSYKPPKGGGSK